MVEKAKAGDKVTITGAPIVVPDVGQMGGDKIQGQRNLDNHKRKGNSMTLFHDLPCGKSRLICSFFAVQKFGPLTQFFDFISFFLNNID